MMILIQKMTIFHSENRNALLKQEYSAYYGMENRYNRYDKKIAIC